MRGRSKNMQRVPHSVHRKQKCRSAVHRSPQPIPSSGWEICFPAKSMCSQAPENTQPRPACSSNPFKQQSPKLDDHDRAVVVNPCSRLIEKMYLASWRSRPWVTVVRVNQVNVSQKHERSHPRLRYAQEASSIRDSEQKLPEGHTTFRQPREPRT
jgi:hypothetical protein